MTIARLSILPIFLLACSSTAPPSTRCTVCGTTSVGGDSDAGTSSNIPPAGTATGSSPSPTSVPPGQPSGQPSSQPSGQPSKPPPGSPPGQEAGAPPPAPPSNYDIAKTFVGPYAGLIKSRKIETVGSFGTFNALVSIYATVAIADDAANKAVTLTAKGCHLDLSGMGTNLLSASMLSLADVVMTTTTLDPVQFSASSSDGGPVTWATSEIHGPIGWHWSSPMDSIPTSSGDSRVYDQDMDGNPGCTLGVLFQGTTTKVFFVQTQRDTLSGSVASNGDLTGTTVDTTDQVVIGSDNSLLQGVMTTWTSDSNTADNTARFVHVPSALDCTTLMAQASTLFK